MERLTIRIYSHPTPVETGWILHKILKYLCDRIRAARLPPCCVNFLWLSSYFSFSPKSSCYEVQSDFFEKLIPFSFSLYRPERDQYGRRERGGRVRGLEAPRAQAHETRQGGAGGRGEGEGRDREVSFVCLFNMFFL